METMNAGPSPDTQGSIDSKWDDGSARSGDRQEKRKICCRQAVGTLPLVKHRRGILCNPPTKIWRVLHSHSFVSCCFHSVCMFFVSSANSHSWKEKNGAQKKINKIYFSSPNAQTFSNSMRAFENIMIKLFPHWPIQPAKHSFIHSFIQFSQRRRGLPEPVFIWFFFRPLTLASAFIFHWRACIYTYVWKPLDDYGWCRGFR